MKKDIALLTFYALLVISARPFTVCTERHGAAEALCCSVQGDERGSELASMWNSCSDAASDSSRAKEILPASNEIEGWSKDGEVLEFYEDNLWEYMDGAAEKFLSFGFEELAVSNYASKEGAGLEVEAFLHGSPLMAYGIYAQMRNPELEFLDIGNEAFEDALSVQFWKGRFYVRVSVFEKDPKLQAAARTFARAIAAKILDAGELPPELGCFPQEGLVARDIRYLAEGVLGRERYPASFVARYVWDRESAELYLSSLGDTSEAVSAYKWFASEIGARENTIQIKECPFAISRGTDPYRGSVVFFRYGRWLVSIIGLGAESHRMEDMVRQTVEKLIALEDRKPSTGNE